MMYKLIYLPIALKDLDNIILYLVNNLHNKKAALDFIDDLDSSLRRLELFPYSGKVYQSQATLEVEFRVFSVKRYLVFYVVIDQYVEIRRIIYGRANIDNRINDSETV